LAWLAYLAGWLWEFARKSASKQIGRKWLTIGAASLLATIITPSGWGNWQAVLGNNSRYILSRTVETMPPDFTQASTFPFTLLLFLSVLTLFTMRKSIPIAHFFLLGGFAVLGSLMARNIPLFAIACAPILAERASWALEKAKRWGMIEANIARLESPLRGAVWPILFVFGFVLIIGGRYQIQKEAVAHFDERVFPVAAADWLVNHPQPGNMFNEFNWGGYLLYRLWPEQKVFLDSQTDFYGEALVQDYERAILAQNGWEDVLAKYQVTWVIVRVSSPLANALAGADWKILYQDKVAIVLAQISTPTSSYPP
jgi:hypothetical protein